MSKEGIQAENESRAWTLKGAVDQMRICDFGHQGGTLASSDAFQWLENAVDNGAIYDSYLDIIIVCAVRYAMGRRTYMPGLVREFCKRNWESIPDGSRAIIQRDLEEELAHEARSQGWLGCEYDVQEWQSFLKWTKDQAQ